jgi:flavin reductase (DIM6/NTAB) family NADH-FMN oxidoreductase RutF
MQKVKIKGFEEIDTKSLSGNVFDMLDDDWMLITAGTQQHFNTMTASWGGFGILWHKPMAICFVRPQRYTLQFLEKAEFFTLSFFTDEYRNALNFCGQKSGRNTDKIKETGLMPIETPNHAIAFEQARLIFECRKVYSDDIKPDKFLAPEIIGHIYPGKDFHRFFIGEISGCYVK